MKRLHLVGTSEDNKRLLLSGSRRAKRGTFEIAITEELRRAVEESEEAQEPVGGGGRAAETGKRGRGLPEGGFAQAARLEDLGLAGVSALIRKTDEPSVAAPPHAADVTEAQGPPPAPTPRPARPQPSVTRRLFPRRKGQRRPTRLTPAQMQALLRTGRTITSVAKQAGAPVEWVRRLAEPIEQERIGAVTQMLQEHLLRPRLGRSGVPLGVALVENLQAKGIRFAERVVEQGWSAARPDGKPWRVRFTYESRGHKRRADWTYDPLTHEVFAVNEVAAELGWRVPMKLRTKKAAAARKPVRKKKSSSRKRSGSTRTRR